MSINVIHTVGELPATVNYVQVVSLGVDRLELRAAGQMIAEAFRRGDDWAIDIKTPTARNLPRFILDDRREATDALRQIGALYLDLRTAVQS
ncbi:Uncharacterised protein [Mycobacteroides abscessus subsp. abscessus]|uniref:hypothetical protein n=1 Tax=Mycobacteroides abscessus TaxID=36809 RepID=UPI000925A121|nr:hypothetical protein [Mycobacteroides abscessus]SHS11499.1 Uncharacterised protein [Mycobacteroides abscessus subsp. abscessus]SHS11532.1 Uncharacterised protein [Mycobacteroides abscessus subsp. abscessus]SHT23022.1 Uncharacterised protein [Mycobacteroides abscessus subsp. abscessus]SHW59367.1 Uncharacterised protein [Mycobacteroides abscessus subsp. abscessus]SIB53416.1 Uncharacterised protein [Mycobacteroides abscessus subsp. abscessus]